MSALISTLTLAGLIGAGIFVVGALGRIIASLNNPRPRPRRRPAGRWHR
jgi:hypothetical protein